MWTRTVQCVPEGGKRDSWKRKEVVDVHPIDEYGELSVSCLTVFCSFILSLTQSFH